jgi:hypothetical protein
MARPWLKDKDGNKIKSGGPKKLLAAAQTRKPKAGGRLPGEMSKRKRGHGWTVKKAKGTQKK